MGISGGVHMWRSHANADEIKVERLSAGLIR